MLIKVFKNNNLYKIGFTFSSLLPHSYHAQRNNSLHGFF
jgi:hypothetical protein